MSDSEESADENILNEDDEDEDDELDSDDEDSVAESPAPDADAVVLPAASPANDDDADFPVTLDEIAEFDRNDVQNFIQKTHPQEFIPSVREVAEKSIVHRTDDESVEDEKHRTLYKMTKFEFVKVIGLRKKQLDDGCEPLIATDLMDSYLIAVEELRQKVLPFIICRYLPNGTEMVRIQDLKINWLP
jgi:DNA-directed RNA polymerase subunit K/omega